MAILVYRSVFEPSRILFSIILIFLFFLYHPLFIDVIDIDESFLVGSLMIGSKEKHANLRSP